VKRHLEDIDYEGLSLCGLLGVTFVEDTVDYYVEHQYGRLCRTCYDSWIKALFRWHVVEHSPKVIKKWRDGKKEFQK
jgi:hypothetical protein